MSQERLKTLLATMSEYVYHGFIFPVETMREMHEIYCSTCGSCGELDCCPPNKCKFGLSYISLLNKKIDDLNKENIATRKALGEYIKNAGFNVSEDIIDKEVQYYGKN